MSVHLYLARAAYFLFSPVLTGSDRWIPVLIFHENFEWSVTEVHRVYISYVRRPLKDEKLPEVHKYKKKYCLCRL